MCLFVANITDNFMRCPCTLSETVSTVWDSCVCFCEQRATSYQANLNLAANFILIFLFSKSFSLLSSSSWLLHYLDVCVDVSPSVCLVFQDKFGSNVQLLSAGWNIFRPGENRCCFRTGGTQPHTVILIISLKTHQPHKRQLLLFTLSSVLLWSIAVGVVGIKAVSSTQALSLWLVI